MDMNRDERGDNRVVLKKLLSEERIQVDACITNPRTIPSVELWKLVYQALKPGGHVISFRGTQPYHRMVVNLEDAGFEIRDQLIYLTPAVEQIVLARKRFRGTVTANVLKYGTGGLNIDACRVGANGGCRLGKVDSTKQGNYKFFAPQSVDACGQVSPAIIGLGRFPANVILNEEAGKRLDEQTGYSKSQKRQYSTREVAKVGFMRGSCKRRVETYDDSGGASRFFCSFTRLQLMRWLCRLVTPVGGTILDPYAGWTSKAAAKFERFNSIMIEHHSA
jgi:site-specific DNA-methyltransferase (adenine-specific)